MKFRLVNLALLALSSAWSATAAPVLYTFSFSGGSYFPGDNRALSFQYRSPSYIGSSLFLNAIRLTHSFISPPDSLFSVTLSQNNLPTYTSVNIEATVLEGNDFNQPISLNFLFSHGPGGPNVFLDRDGTYTYTFSNLPYWSGGTGSLSVALTPEPTSLALLLFGIPGICLLVMRHRRAGLRVKGSIS